MLLGKLVLKITGNWLQKLEDGGYKTLYFSVKNIISVKVLQNTGFAETLIKKTYFVNYQCAAVAHRLLMPGDVIKLLGT